MEQPVIKEGTLALIDTFAYLFRSYYMSAKTKPLTNDKGFPTGLLTGLVGMVKNFIRIKKHAFYRVRPRKPD